MTHLARLCWNISVEVLSTTTVLWQWAASSGALLLLCRAVPDAPCCLSAVDGSSVGCLLWLSPCFQTRPTARPKAPLCR